MVGEVQGCDFNVSKYDLRCDPDINGYETDDLKEITKSGMGVAGGEVVVNLDIIVFLLIAAFILTIIGVVIYKAKKLGK